MLKHLIINADDFGLSAEVNQGILECFEEGVVTSTSLLPNGPVFGQAIEAIRQSNIPVGIHFILTNGEPVMPAERVPSLVDKRGYFWNKWQFTRRVFEKKIRPQEVVKELYAQIRKCVDHGIEFDHFDSHHHVHSLPGIEKYFSQIVAEFGLTACRKIRHTGYFMKPLKSHIIQNTIAVLDSSTHDHQFHSPDQFYGFNLMADENKHDALHHILAHIRPGIAELMCHPGYASMGDIGRYNKRRFDEKKALCSHDIKTHLENRHIELISFSDFYDH